MALFALATALALPHLPAAPSTGPRTLAPVSGANKLIPTLPGAAAAGSSHSVASMVAPPLRPTTQVATTVDLVTNQAIAGNAAPRYANTPGGIAYDSLDQIVFVSGSSSAAIVAVDPSSGIVQTLALPLVMGNSTAIQPTPTALAFDSVDRKLFASDPALDRIEIFNVSASNPYLSFERVINLTPGTHPAGLLAVSSPDLVFVADESLDQVTALSGSNASIMGNVTVGGGPVSLCYDPVTGLVFVADSATADTVWFSAAGLAVGPSPFPVHNTPLSIAFDPTANQIWIATGVYITILDATSRASAFNVSFPSGTHIGGLLWDPIVGLMAVANAPAGTVSYLNSTGVARVNASTYGAPSTMVENSNLQEIDVLDPASNDLIRVSDLALVASGSDRLGVTPGLAAFDPVTDRIEVPDVTSDRILEVDVHTLAPGAPSVVRSLFVPGHPVAAAFDPVTGAVIVALMGGVVVALNATSGALLHSDNLGSSYTLYDVLFADGQIFVTGGGNLLWSLDARTLAVAVTIPVSSLPSSPRLMAYAAATQLLYVTLMSANSLAIVNASTDVEVTTIAAGPSPYGVAYAPSSGDLFVADSAAGVLDVIHAASRASVAQVPVGYLPSDVLYVPGTQQIFATATRSDNVTIISANSFAVSATVPVGEWPSGLVLSNVTGDVYVSDVPDSAVSVIPATAPGPAPFSAQLAVNPARTDVGTTVQFTTSTSYPAWDFSYQYVGLPANCASANASVIRCVTSGAPANLSTNVFVTSIGGERTNASVGVDLIPSVSIAAFSVSRTTLTLGTPVVFNLSAQGGTLPYTISYPTLPPGCPAQSVARFVCSPDRVGQYSANVLVVDAVRLPATASLNLIVNPLLVSNPSVTASSIVLGATVTILANVSEGTPPYTISYTGLPPGCASANTSSLRCEPTGTGSFSISIHMVDASGSPAVRTVSLDVQAPPPPATATPVALYLGIGAVVIVAVVVAIIAFRRKGGGGESLSTGEDGGSAPADPAIYSTGSRTVPRLPVGPVEAHGPVAEPSTPRYYTPAPEEESPAPAPNPPSAGPTASRPVLVCRTCGTVNEPWITHCRSCKRPLQST